MNGIIMHKPVSRRPEFPEVPNIGVHGIKNFNKLSAVDKPLMDTGLTASTSTEILIYTERQ
jgi:hypothetical protein